MVIIDFTTNQISESIILIIIITCARRISTVRTFTHARIFAAVCAAWTMARISATVETQIRIVVSVDQRPWLAQFVVDCCREHDPLNCPPSWCNLLCHFFRPAFVVLIFCAIQKTESQVGHAFDRLGNPRCVFNERVMVNFNGDSAKGREAPLNEDPCQLTPLT